MNEIRNYFEFANEEIKDYLVEHVLSKRMDITDRIRFLSDDGEEIDPDGNNKIDFVVFDGTNEELFVNFFRDHVSIFIKEKEIMFIDESSINTYTSSDIVDNVVYEGKILDTSHQCFLEKLAEIILCFIDATNYVVEYIKDSKLQDHKYFEAFRYNINVEKCIGEHGIREYGNIRIVY
ncbi:MAG: hypothetical protein IIT46_14065 [Lachnospiraceae bacterium]|nr:hypothetical protein [Lachnospiraceae bacterium]